MSRSPVGSAVADRDAGMMGRMAMVRGRGPYV